MAARTDGRTHPLRVCVFDNMRARSHIFSRLFSEHPQIQQVYHPFLMASFLGPERMTAHTKHSERREKEVNEYWLPLYVPDTYGTSRKWLEDEMREIEWNGKIAWMNEHSSLIMRQDIMLTSNRGHKYTPADIGHNPTYLPDWIFDTCSPIMVIRHPALMVPSFYETMHRISYNLPGDEDFKLCTSQHYCRLIFDVFESQGRRPIVVDGEDVVWRTEEMTNNVCKALGIDSAGVAQTWQPTPPEKRPQHPIIAAFTKTVHESTGVERPAKKRDGPVDIDTEMNKAAERYGEKVAAQLREYVEEYMPDYQYLVQFKV